MMNTLLALVVAVSSVTLADAAAAVETDGVVCLNVDSQPLPDDNWTERTKFQDHTSNVYYQSNNSSLPEPTEDQGVISYPFLIQNGGDYQFQWRSFNARALSRGDNNDNWIRIIDSNGNPVVGVDPPDHALEVRGNTWYKVFMNEMNTWCWDARTVEEVGRALKYPLVSGQEYTLQLAFRSRSHAIDKLLLWNTGSAYIQYADTETGRVMRDVQYRELEEVNVSLIR